VSGEGTIAADERSSVGALQIAGTRRVPIPCCGDHPAAAARQAQWAGGSADADAAALRGYAAELAAGPFAIHQDAQPQHYELPTAFFREFWDRASSTAAAVPDGVDDLRPRRRPCSR